MENEEKTDIGYTTHGERTGEEMTPAAGQQDGTQRKWYKRLADSLRPQYRRVADWLKRRFGKYISTTFLAMLVISVLLWYMIKLGGNYVTEIPIVVDIEGHEVKVTCVVEGDGFNLFANRYYKRNELKLRWNDVDATPSVINQGYVVVSPYSLQNAISARKPDIRIISIGTIPEIEL